MPPLRRSSVWVALNLAGAVLYIFLGAHLWVAPGDEGLPGGPGDAFYWFLTQVPIAVFFVLLDFAALIAILRRTNKTRRLFALYLWVAVAFVWVLVVAYDHHRGQRFISPEFALVGASNAA